MNRSWIVVGAIAVLSACALFWVLHENPQSASPQAVTSKPSPSTSERQALPTPPAYSQVRGSMPSENIARDALDETSALIRNAEGGQANAQFRLYELLSGCKTQYWRYFSRGEDLLGKEEAAIRMEALATVDEDAVDVYRTCHRLMEQQPLLTATADSWLEKALAQGHPRAQVARAAELLAAVAVPIAPGVSVPPNAAHDARALLKKAIASGDPFVVMMLGELRPSLGGSAEETNKERWAMELAACSRGLECGPDAKWVRSYCKADPANLCPINANAEEMIRSKTGSDFEMIKLRAQEINALIDAGNAQQLVPSP
jgi:hypothetical protein